MWIVTWSWILCCDLFLCGFSFLQYLFSRFQAFRIRNTSETSACHSVKNCTVVHFIQSHPQFQGSQQKSWAGGEYCPRIQRESGQGGQGHPSQGEQDQRACCDITRVYIISVEFYNKWEWEWDECCSPESPCLWMYAIAEKPGQPPCCAHKHQQRNLPEGQWGHTQKKGQQR